MSFTNMAGLPLSQMFGVAAGTTGRPSISKRPLDGAGCVRNISLRGTTVPRNLIDHRGWVAILRDDSDRSGRRVAGASARVRAADRPGRDRVGQRDPQE